MTEPQAANLIWSLCGLLFAAICATCWLRDRDTT
jgi:hypothetical protein